MEKILTKGNAEIALPLKQQDECLYLPLFGVYHPEKPEQFQVVFNSSYQYNGVSLNNVHLKRQWIQDDGPYLREQSFSCYCDLWPQTSSESLSSEQMLEGLYKGITQSVYIRMAGFWIMGAKRCICSLIYGCTSCRKLCEQSKTQKMADLPMDRVSNEPPFT